MKEMPDLSHPFISHHIPWQKETTQQESRDRANGDSRRPSHSSRRSGPSNAGSSRHTSPSPSVVSLPDIETGQLSGQGPQLEVLPPLEALPEPEALGNCCCIGIMWSVTLWLYVCNSYVIIYVYHTFYFYILASHRISWATLRDGSLPLNASYEYWIPNQDKPYKQILWSPQIALSTMLQPNKELPYFAHMI